MWRAPAVRDLVLEVAALRTSGDPTEALRAARRRALAVVAVDVVAIVVLVLFGEGNLSLGGSPRSVLTLGLLAVAAHAGFRLSQALTWGAALRACERLGEIGGEPAGLASEVTEPDD